MIEDLLEENPFAATIIGDIITNAGQGMQRSVTVILANKFMNATYCVCLLYMSFKAKLHTQHIFEHGDATDEANK
ncbi:hypothetical protein RCC89_01980 [Cytophagaceae bacterium ABcell3]|nr:hypothetical protein RCC89_01980 [Cytophagaceae bacterium ABcell3]